MSIVLTTSSYLQVFLCVIFFCFFSFSSFFCDVRFHRFSFFFCSSSCFLSENFHHCFKDNRTHSLLHINIYVHVYIFSLCSNLNQHKIKSWEYILFHFVKLFDVRGIHRNEWWDLSSLQRWFYAKITETINLIFFHRSKKSETDKICASFLFFFCCFLPFLLCNNRFAYKIPENQTHKRGKVCSANGNFLGLFAKRWVLHTYMEFGAHSSVSHFRK